MSEEIITDPGLSQLREQTKNIMIPLLIKVFQLKSEAQSLTAPPSRLYSSAPKGSLDEVVLQLTSLEKDLKLQQNWIESSRSQIEKILAEIKEQPTGSLNGQIKTSSTTGPKVQKPFQHAFSFQKDPSKKNSFSLQSLWKKILGTQ